MQQRIAIGVRAASEWGKAIFSGNCCFWAEDSSQKNEKSMF